MATMSGNERRRSFSLKADNKSYIGVKFWVISPSLYFYYYVKLAGFLGRNFFLHSNVVSNPKCMKYEFVTKFPFFIYFSFEMKIFNMFIVNSCATTKQYLFPTLLSSLLYRGRMAIFLHGFQ